MQSKTEQQVVLIVDDSPTNVEILSDCLNQPDFQIVFAPNGERALEQAIHQRPELILLDVIMPGIDGFETCRRLKENPDTCNIPVIFMTALSDAENKVKGLSLGAIDYVTKPFQYEEVLARVRIHLKVQNLAKTLRTQNILLKKEIDLRELTEIKLLEANNALADLNQQLENRVTARTAELSKALQDLQQTQVSMIHQEKLSALGQLVAGVAHEINNPVNFIHGNILHASEYAKDLLRLLSLYRQHYDGTEASEIADELKTIDIDFLSEDLPKLISSMAIGADRIRDIVLSLRIFSRLDEVKAKYVDLHQGIDSTLLILNSRIKSNGARPQIKIIKEYGDVPEVRCYAGQLNQVFMNILSNAIDALEGKYEQLDHLDHKGWQPQIKIRTELIDGQSVGIHLFDNGPGIPVALREKVFSPFFTTKPAGKGTGLGMSISHKIVAEKHQGTLTYAPVDPEGTQFTITIPVDQLKMSDPQDSSA
ncbi:MAG: response regulator [Phormidesmis sp.]